MIAYYYTVILQSKLYLNLKHIPLGKRVIRSKFLLFKTEDFSVKNDTLDHKKNPILIKFIAQACENLKKQDRLS